MNDLEFLDRAETLLRSVEVQCDQLNEGEGVDIDNQRAGNMVTLGFSNGSQIVINLQKPLHEVWMASKAGGFHYRWVDNVWRDTKTGQEFFAELSRAAGAQTGQNIRFQSV